MESYRLVENSAYRWELVFLRRDIRGKTKQFHIIVEAELQDFEGLVRPKPHKSAPMVFGQHVLCLGIKHTLELFKIILKFDLSRFWSIDIQQQDKAELPISESLQPLV
jgi:hypothetical protein